MSAAAPRSPLRLLAADAQDLEVISAALQDAVLKVGDIHWEPAARRLTLELNRFRWETQDRTERVRTGLKELKERTPGWMHPASGALQKQARGSTIAG